MFSFNVLTSMSLRALFRAFISSLVIWLWLSWMLVSCGSSPALEDKPMSAQPQSLLDKNVVAENQHKTAKKTQKKKKDTSASEQPSTVLSPTATSSSGENHNGYEIITVTEVIPTLYSKNTNSTEITLTEEFVIELSNPPYLDSSETTNQEDQPSTETSTEDNFEGSYEGNYQDNSETPMQQETPETVTPPAPANIPEPTHSEQYSAYEATIKKNTQCGVIYPNLERVATPILRNVMSLDVDDIYDYAAKDVVRGTQTMLANMMADPEWPIHPLAFFATIKHFESSNRTTQWGYWNFNFFSRHCSSGVCSGYFQVDVDLEKDWSLTEVCGKNGLNVLGLEGGPDFCSILFWWTKAAGTTKCKNMGGAGNPCLDKGYAWNINTFKRGHLTYGQGNQWHSYGIHDPWKHAYVGGMLNGSYFTGYENCAAKHYAYSTTPQQRIRQAVDDFAQAIGFQRSQS
ncbi:MAG: hypothetical protein OXC44_03975 [Proteobacteria bacterium]|nr:hypothetical protein [Pseudomonadota bacterium]